MANIYVRVCAALIILRSFTNFAKVFGDNDVILVFFGQILRGGQVAVPSVLIGVLMLATGVAMWTGGKWALPLIAVYAAYVFVNLLMWTVSNPAELERVGGMVSSATEPGDLRMRGALAFLGYCIVAIATTAVPAWLLWKQRAGR
jgi:hypothetical protein